MAQQLETPVPVQTSQRGQQDERHPQWAFFQGRIVPIEQAHVSIMTQVVNYGIGAFGGIRGYWNAEQEQLYVFRVKDHYRRLVNSGRLLNAHLRYSVDELAQMTVELLRREGYRQDAYVRPLIYNATEDIAPRLYDVEFDLACFSRPQGNYIKLELNACVSSWRRLDDNVIPARAKITGGYVNSAFARSEAHWNGYDEAIVLTHEGHVAEGSAENLLMVRNGCLCTPPITDNVLEGITRSTVLQLAHDELGLTVLERSIDRSELYVADEVMLCGTGAQIAAVAQIDHRPVGSGKAGPVALKLQDLYFRVVRGQVPKYESWLTPVYA